jgi:hypothetical protein
MHSQDEFKYFDANTKDPIGKYVQPKVYASVVVGEEDNDKYLRETPTSVANSRSQAYKPTKTSGEKIRGTGAATKGTKFRGPSA